MAATPPTTDPTTDPNPAPRETNYIHDELALSLARLLQFRRDRDQSLRLLTHKIEDLEALIERQVFDCLPELAARVCYGDGDPIEFFVGRHRVRVYLIKGKPEICIDRSHVLETDIDLFAEAEAKGGPA